MIHGRVGKDRTVSAVRRRVAAARLVSCLAAAIVGFVVLQPARAEVRISGQPNALKIEAHNATVDDVLRALQASYKFRFESAHALTNPAGGIYTGSLSRVVGRLLDGQNYVMRHSAGGVKVSIISSGQPVARSQPQFQPAQGEPPKECKYDDGTRVIAVEC
jgi:hypothetical protein